ncbi:hypothetical protein VTI74DRAFT_6433 [Chaetomium olivicolor]
MADAPPPASTMPQDATSSETTQAQSKKLINLLRGWPSPALLPKAHLLDASHRVLSTASISTPALQYAPDPGYQPLIDSLAQWLSASYPSFSPSSSSSSAAAVAGIRPDEIAITGGASQSLACILQSYTDPGYTRAVWAVAPCYFLGCPIFEDAGFSGRVRAVREDEAGLDLEALEEGFRRLEEQWQGQRQGEEGRGEIGKGVYKDVGPHRKLYRHVVYLVATCANPSGKTMGVERRLRLVQLARKYDALVVSDDVYDFLQWPVSPIEPAAASTLPRHSPLPPLLPLLSQIDAALGPSQHNPPGKNFGHAVSNASFSKLVGPGMRTGWIHATADFAFGFSQTGTNRSGGAASQFAAAVVHQVMAAGALEKWLAEVVRPGLRRRHGLMLEAVRKELGPLGVSVWGGNGLQGVREGGGKGDRDGDGKGGVFGGYFVWLTLPLGLDANVVAERAKEGENLIIAPGRLFEVRGDEEAARFPGNVRLCFSWEDEEDVVEGVRRLGSVLRRMLDRTDSKTERREGGGTRAEGFK